MRALYNIAILAYGLGIRMASLFSEKGAKWVRGRRDWRKLLREKIQTISHQDQPLVWMHCASLGEFEQGRPVLEALRAADPNIRILLSFYSPSGYEVRKDYPVADLITYLPLDTPSQAKDWVAITQPELAIFVKYDFWYNMLASLKKQEVPSILISGLFHPGQLFFRSYGGFFRNGLNSFERIFVQDTESKEMLNGLGIKQVEVAGDNRIDRVARMAEAARELPLIHKFSGEDPVLVVGSNWDGDDEILFPFLNGAFPSSWKVIMAPHQVDDSTIERLLRQLGPKAIRFSHLKMQEKVSDFEALSSTMWVCSPPSIDMASLPTSVVALEPASIIRWNLRPSDCPFCLVRNMTASGRQERWWQEGQPSPYDMRRS